VALLNHLIGKEILRFHTVWWPAMCMAAGLEPVHHVHVNGWLLIGGEKLGKTMAAEGAVKITDIEPIGLSQEFGVDPLRYYLLRETALGNDGEFSLEGIAARYNTDLANNLGNLVARVSPPSSRRSATASVPRPKPTRRCAKWPTPSWPAPRMPGSTSLPNEP
jgi:methionyl-tRNA synthetase